MLAHPLSRQAQLDPPRELSLRKRSLGSLLTAAAISTSYGERPPKVPEAAVCWRCG